MSVARADFSAWLASGRNSDVKLLIVIEDDGVPPAPKQRRCEPGEGEDAAARGARRGVVHREFAAHSVILEEACGWARAMLGSPESVEVRGPCSISQGCAKVRGAAQTQLRPAWCVGRPLPTLHRSIAVPGAHAAGGGGG